MMADEKTNFAELEVFRMMQESGKIEIAPYSGDPDSKSGFKKISLASDQRMQMDALSGHLPTILATDAMANAYTVRFPEGIQGHLMRYKDGTLGTPIQGADSKIIGHASLERMSTHAAILGAFNTMALVSGQYFLSEINSKLEKISLSIDKILEFLYGEKRAELLSEISFTKYAYENYSSIMTSDAQRIATIASLQEAKKVAIKDIEFYAADLDSTTNTKELSDLPGLVDKVFQIKDCMVFSVQLCVMTTILEMYYAQNYTPAYIDYIEQELKGYINKCDNWILKDFGALNAKIAGFKDKLLAKAVNKEPLMARIEKQIEQRTSGGESALHKSLHAVLRAPCKSVEYCVSSNGAIYLKTA